MLRLSRTQWIIDRDIEYTLTEHASCVIIQRGQAVIRSD